MSAPWIEALCARAKHGQVNVESAVIADAVKSLHITDLARLRTAFESATAAGPNRTLIEFADGGFRVHQYRNNQVHKRFTVRPPVTSLS